MGGNALSDGLTERKALPEYVDVKEEVLGRLCRSGAHVMDVSELPEMPCKQEFGDLDLLYVIKKGYNHDSVLSLIRSLFAPCEIVRSGPVTSFDFRKFQIDLIESSEEKYAMTKFSLSYGDRGMILGSIARWQGFSLGANGLIISNHDVGSLLDISGISESIVLSTDPGEIRRYMGLPSDDSSLQRPEDVMEFCMSTPWFRPEQFTRTLNVEGKRRCKKRPFFQSFTTKIIERYGYGDANGLGTGENSFPVETDKKCPCTSADDHRAIRRANIEDALTFFGKWEELYSIRDRYERKQRIKERLNYKHFLDLGLFTHDLKNARESFLEWFQQTAVVGDSGDADVDLDELLLSESVDSVKYKLALWFDQEWKK